MRRFVRNSVDIVDEIELGDTAGCFAKDSVDKTRCRTLPGPFNQIHAFVYDRVIRYAVEK